MIVSGAGTTPFPLQRTQLIDRVLCKVIPLDLRGITLHNALTYCCVRCSGKIVKLLVAGVFPADEDL